MFMEYDAISTLSDSERLHYIGKSLENYYDSKGEGKNG